MHVTVVDCNLSTTTSGRTECRDLSFVNFEVSDVSSSAIFDTAATELHKKGKEC